MQNKIYVPLCICLYKFMSNVTELCMERDVSRKASCLTNIPSSSSYERNQINDSFLSPEPSKLAFTGARVLFLLSRRVAKQPESTISISSFAHKSNPPLTCVPTSLKTVSRCNFLQKPNRGYSGQCETE